jgi:hypothetical protein
LLIVLILSHVSYNIFIILIANYFTAVQTQQVHDHNSWTTWTSPHTHNIVEPAPTVKLTYLLSILSAEEATKPVSKHLPVSDCASAASLELGAEEPWDRLKAQLLMKIDETLAPWALNFDDYLTMFYIPCVLPEARHGAFYERKLHGTLTMSEKSCKQDTDHQPYYTAEERRNG